MEMQHMIYRSYGLPEQSCRGRDQTGAVVVQWAAAQTNQLWTPSAAQRMLRRPRWARGQIVPRLQSPHSVSGSPGSARHSDLHSERAHPAQLSAWHYGCFRAEAGLAQQKRQCRSWSWQFGAGGGRGWMWGASADAMWWEKHWKDVLWAHIAAPRSTGEELTFTGSWGFISSPPARCCLAQSSDCAGNIDWTTVVLAVAHHAHNLALVLIFDIKDKHWFIRETEREKKKSSCVTWSFAWQSTCLPISLSKNLFAHWLQY